MSRLANTLWYLGQPESALRTCAQALALADDIGYPFSRATVLVFAALLALDMRDLERFREWVASLVAASAQLKAQQILVAVACYTGICDVLDGHTEVGMARLQGALQDTVEAQHSPGQHAMIARWLIEACGVARDPQLGLAAADQALEASGARLWDAESHRWRAEFLAMRGAPPQDVERELRSALRIARRQRARMFELRAAVSLLRHRLDHGDGQSTREARARLEAIVKAIPGQVDTPDLREATTLLRTQN
jgi:adenylate cyclase